jgi:hypothetical protein
MTNFRENFEAPGTTGTTGPYEWSVNQDGTLTITKYNPPPITTSTNTAVTTPVPTIFQQGNCVPLKNPIGGPPLSIPSTFNNMTVTILGPNSFQNSLNFDTVIIPSSITTIGDSAFMGCINLFYLSISENGSLRTISSNAFSGTYIRTPRIPASVNNIGDNAFSTDILYSVTFLGNCPAFTNAAFNNTGGGCIYAGNAAPYSPGELIVIYYFNDKNGFDSLDNKHFIPVPVTEMFIPIDPTTYNPIWIILLIVFVVIIVLYGAAKLI